jgi:branched-chain amino acid transport system ATP-binding protein
MIAIDPLLEGRGLHTYYGASHILHSVDIAVQRGQTVCFMGRNGMGKTTTLRTLLGLTPPREGQVLMNGRDVTGKAPHWMAKAGIAYVPEDRGIFPTLTVRENLIMAARSGPTGRKDWDLRRVLDLFPRLAERSSNLGNQLSGGEQQMLTVGRALMTNPDLILLDEATEGLAPLIRKEIWSVIGRIKEAGIASIVVDKDVKPLMEIADLNVIIAKGRIVYQGSSDELAANPEIHRQYLGV